MTKTMAEVIVAHGEWRYTKGAGSPIVCRECGAPINSNLAAHQAAELSAAGFGLVADAGAILQATDLIRDLIDPDECSFDHHGGCQAHGYLSLQPGEMCPQLEAKAWVHNQDAAAVRGEG